MPGLIAEGLNLLAGAPKLGKSWLALNIALAVASGGRALGIVRVEQGEALYLALEDPPRRLQERQDKILKGARSPAGITFETDWPRLPDGGADRLDAWLDEHPACRLVVVDVLARIRGQTSAQANQYSADYLAMTALKAVADRHATAVLVVHHTRKADADDPFDTISGTQGVAGCADAVLVMRRSRYSPDAVLHLTGRDIEEVERAMRFDPACGTWALMEGTAAEHELSEARRKILAVLSGPDDKPLSMTPKQVATVLRMKDNTARQHMARMAKDGQLNVYRGIYSIPGSDSEVSPETLPLTSKSDSSDRSDSSTGVTLDGRPFSDGIPPPDVPDWLDEDGGQP